MTRSGAINRVLVVGAGLSGLSAAVRLAQRGLKVTVIEAAMQAGGRCRSYHDPVLDMTIDNGNHFVVSGNSGVNSYLELLGATSGLCGLGDRGPSFHDLRDGATWTLWPNDSALPWWIFAPARRVPGTQPGDYLMLAPLLFPPAGKRIDEIIGCGGPLWERLFGPFLLGALNTEPRSASAELAGAVIRKTFARGGHAYRPRVAHPNLSATFVDPAVVYLREHGADVRLGQRVRGLSMAGDRVEALACGDGAETLADDTAVILATPPWISGDLIPGLTVPNEFSAIVNAHFRIAPPEGAAPMLGVIGGAAEWVFAFADRLSVTVSGANAIVDEDRQVLAERFWKRCFGRAWPGPRAPRVAGRQGTACDISRHARAEWTPAGRPNTLEEPVPRR